MPDTGLPSPCVRNCCLDEQDICLGCGRSLDEIRDWGGAPDSRRRQILAQAAARQAERAVRLRALHRPDQGG